MSQPDGKVTPNFVHLIAMADAMIVEEDAERQKKYDIEHPENNGMVRAAAPMESAFRTYQFWRCQWSEALGLPNPMTTLRIKHE